MKWFRSYHGMCDDPKLTAVAMTAGVHHCFAVAAWQAVLEHASMQDDRGSIAGLDAMTIAIRIRIELPQATAIMTAMRHLGMIDDARVIAWVKRQKASDDGAKRIAEWRKKAGNGTKRAETQENGNGGNEQDRGDVTLQGAECNVTFAQSIIESESTNVDSSPPISPRPDPVTSIDEPEFELVEPSLVCTTMVAYGSTPILPAKRETVPYGEAAEIWNTIGAKALPSMVKWTDKRKRLFAVRFKQDCGGNLEVWREVCLRVRASDFCCGESRGGWRADIDFVLNESNWVKIIEGKYDNTNRRQKPTGVIGALAILREKDLRDGLDHEDDGMSDYERELLQRPAWQDALEGPTH